MKSKLVQFACGLILASSTSVVAQDGIACKILRNADLAQVLRGDIGYNSNSFRQGNFDVSFCNAIGDEQEFVSMRMYSYANTPDLSEQDLRNGLRDFYNPDIPYFTGVPVTENSVYYSEGGELFFWSTDDATMYIIRDASDNWERIQRRARIVARSLGLEKDEVPQVNFN